VFVTDAEQVSTLLNRPDDMEDAVRHARNLLDVEAVSLVRSDGMVLASSSATLLDKTLTNSLLSFGAISGRFVALASPIGDDLQIDGINEWPAGSVLYQVVSPLPDSEQSVLIHYDLSGLLARRTQPGAVQPETIQLLALGGVFALLGGAVTIGHMRASRRYRDIALESELLRVHSDELKATNRELDAARTSAESALALAEEKMRIRSEFVLMINHELRTPLTSVVTGAELLNGEQLTPRESRHVLKAMVSDGRRLQEIIDQILVVARIENRGLSYELSSVSLERVCGALLASQPALISGHTDEPHDHVVVKTDISALVIVVASLVDNAMTHGAKKVQVSCSTEPSVDAMAKVGAQPNEAVFIIVKDDGPGIDEEFLPRIFEKFEKASFSSATGLGLYAARLMIEALEGSIAVQTSEQGTIFEIALPSVLTNQMVAAK